MSHQLEQHLASLGIRLGSAALVREGEGGPFAVVAATHIPALAVVASAPKTATLSPRTSALAQHLNTLPSALASPALQLATCVLFETLLGERSRWSVYLAHLPHDLSTVGGVWDSDGIPMAWVRGTELEKELQRVGVSHSTLSALYATYLLPYITPLVLPLASQPTLSLFLRSYAHVTSRAFLIDNFHHLALVPLFDLFNHSTDAPHVHLESHEWVCAVCGHWDWCEHERDELGGDAVGARGPKDAQTQLAPMSNGREDEDGRIELVAHALVERGEEVFNTYGATLSNARLLIEYGFISEANPWDLSSFAPDEVLASPVDLNSSTASVRELVAAADSGDGPLTAAQGHEGGDLFFDADANVSVGLWSALVCRHGGPQASSAGLYRRLEACWDEAQEGDSFAPEDSSGEQSDLNALNFIARDIVILARGRRTGARVHRPDLSPTDLLALADEEPDAATRLAMEFAAGERLMLLCVEERWTNLRRYLDGGD